MTTSARLRRARQRERRATFRDWDILLLSVFVGLPIMAAIVAYLIRLDMVPQWGLSVTFMVCVYRQVERQKVPVAFYRAFEGGK